MHLRGNRRWVPRDKIFLKAQSLKRDDLINTCWPHGALP